MEKYTLLARNSEGNLEAEHHFEAENYVEAQKTADWFLEDLDTDEPLSIELFTQEG